jgi:hypothetical protein
MPKDVHFDRSAAMSKRKSKPSAKAQPGRGDSAGARFRPTDLSEEETQDSPSERALPSPGLPISDQEYKELQEQSRHRTLPPTRTAQEDTSG